MNPDDWLQEHGYPLRGIIAGRGGPTERLASFVDFFLQPGMKKLPSFLIYIWCVSKLGNIFGSPMQKKFFLQRPVQKKYGVVDENKICSREIKQHST